MSLEIIVGIIAFSFLTLAIVSILALQRLRKVIKKLDHVLSEAHHLIRELTDPSVELIENTNELIADVKKTSEGINSLFRPLQSLKKEKSANHTGLEKVSDLLRFVSDGIHLFNKIKNEMK